MARIRTIKPEFPQSESMGRISRDARLLFILLWTIADDSGRARGSSRMLASLLTPYDDDAPALMNGWLLELEREGCIRRYDVDGSTYVEIVKWLKHQKIDKPSQSRLPTFEEGSPIVAKPREASSTDLEPRSKTLDSGPNTSDHGPETLDLGSATKDLSTASRPPATNPQGQTSRSVALASKGTPLPTFFQQFYAAYPRKKSPGNAEAALGEVLKKKLATEAEIMAGVERLNQHFALRPDADRQYIPYPAKWLQSRAWADELETARSHRASAQTNEMHGAVSTMQQWAEQ